jgi:hypothetical protein
MDAVVTIVSNHRSSLIWLGECLLFKKTIKNQDHAQCCVSEGLVGDRFAAFHPICSNAIHYSGSLDLDGFFDSLYTLGFAKMGNMFCYESIIEQTSAIDFARWNPRRFCVDLVGVGRWNFSITLCRNLIT